MITKSREELILEIQEYLLKFKKDNDLNFKQFEEVVCKACNEITHELGERYKR